MDERDLKFATSGLIDFTKPKIMIPENIAEQLVKWEEMGKNYSPTFNWTELNELAIKLGNTPFNLGCGDCRKNLLEYLLAMVKENGTL